jgi:hypothetical protein
MTRRIITTVAGLALLAFGVVVALQNPAAWPTIALAAFVIGCGVAYAGWTGQTIREAGTAGVKMAVEPEQMVEVAQRTVAVGRELSTAWNVEESGTGHDRVTVQKYGSAEEYRRRARDAKTPEELAVLLTEAVVAAQREDAGPQIGDQNAQNKAAR